MGLKQFPGRAENRLIHIGGFLKLSLPRMGLKVSESNLQGHQSATETFFPGDVANLG